MIAPVAKYRAHKYKVEMQFCHDLSTAGHINELWVYYNT